MLRCSSTMSANSAPRCMKRAMRQRSRARQVRQVLHDLVPRAPVAAVAEEGEPLPEAELRPERTVVKVRRDLVVAAEGAEHVEEPLADRIRPRAAGASETVRGRF